MGLRTLLESLAAKFVDYAALSLLTAGRAPYFRESRALPTTTLLEQLERWKHATVDMQPMEARGDRTRYRVCVRLGERSFESSLYHERPPDAAGRLIVYHHGLAEFPPWRSFNGLISRAPEPLAAERVLVVALGHDVGRRDLRRRLARLEGFEEMLACGVATAKAAADRFGERAERRVFVGISLGGIASLIETLHEPRFDANVALLTTPFLARKLLKSSFTRAVATGFRGRVRAADLARLIDLDQIVGRNDRRIVMINGRYDTMVDLDRLAAWWAERPAIETHVLPVSHLSIALRPQAMQRCLAEVLRREFQRAERLDRAAVAPVD